MNVTKHSAHATLLMLLAAMGLSGCGGDGIKTVPVYGTVTFAGRERPKVCRLFFRPVTVDGPSRPSLTEVAADGSYVAKAFQESDGLIPGTYHVGVSYFDLKRGGNPDSESSYVERQYDAGELTVDAEADEVEHNIEVPQAGG